MIVIGLSGPAGSGKNFIADIIQEVLEDEHGISCRQWAFAHALKAQVYAKVPGFSLEDITIHKPKDVRDTLQQEGTEKARDVFGKDYWVAQAEYFIHGVSPSGIDAFIFTDCRFPNEVEFVKHGGRAPGRVDRELNDLVADGINWDDVPDEQTARKLDEEFLQSVQQATELLKETSPSLALYVASDRNLIQDSRLKQHRSETSLSAASPVFDGVIQNHRGTSRQDLREQVRRYINQLTQG